MSRLIVDYFLLVDYFISRLLVDYRLVDSSLRLNNCVRYMPSCRHTVAANAMYSASHVDKATTVFLDFQEISGPVLVELKQ